MNKEKSFAKELAELINRHSIDAKFETADDILATVAIDALNAYAKAKQTQERRNNPDADTCDCPICQLRRAMEKAEKSRPQPGGVVRENAAPEKVINKRLPKEVADITDAIRVMFPGAEISVGVVEMPRRNPRFKRRGKNKRNGKGGNK